MLSVALFSHSRYLCGAERMLLNLALLLERSRTIRPILLVPGEGELLSETRRHGLACQIVPEPPWYLLQPNTLPHMNVYCRGVTTCTEALKRILVDLNSDAILVNTTTNVPAMLAAVALNIPSLLWVHGVIDSLLLPCRTSEFATRHDELLLHSATRVLALANYTSDFAARVMQRAQVDVVRNWTPVDPQFNPPPDKYRSRQFACLNTFDPHKGYITLLQAADLLRARNLDFELHLYGDGGLRGEMEKWALALGLRDYVRFQGRTTNVQEVYDRSLAVVNTAQVEPFGMTLIEAMARKTPVVATRSGGPEDIVVDGQCGYLVDRGDAVAVADRMQALLESPELAQRLGEEGFQRACSCYSEEAAQAAFLPLIEEAVRDFHGYEPVVKTLVNIYRLWLERAVARPARSRPAPLSVASSIRTAARLAREGIRRTQVLKNRLLAVLGLDAAARSRATTVARLRNLLPGPIDAKAAVDPSGGPRKFHPLRRKIRYRLVPDQGNWAGLDVLVRRNPLLATGQLRLCVRSASRQVLRETAISLDSVREKGWLGFRFSPITNAAGTPFEVEFAAENPFPTAAMGICEGDTPETACQETADPCYMAPGLGLPRRKKALYCRTWHT